MTTSRQTLATLILLALLIVSLWISTWYLAASNHTATTLGLVSLLKTLPLAAFWRPLWRQRALSGIWFSLLLMPYLCLAILGAQAPGAAGIISAWHTLLIAACCTSALLEAQRQAKLAKTHGMQD